MLQKYYENGEPQNPANPYKLKETPGRGATGCFDILRGYKRHSLIGYEMA